MRLNLFEAEDDYIRVGNIMLPKDASQYGYDSYDTVTRKTQQKYDDEKEAERLAKEREEAERQKQAFIKEHEAEISVARDILESDKTADEKLEDLFKPFVKGSGKSDTQGGEIVRAYNRLAYRNFNDGDLYFEAYGLETCGGDATFLIDETNDTIAKLLTRYADKHIEDYQVNDDAYTKFIEEDLAGAIVNYLEENLDLFAVPAVADSRSYDSEVDDSYIEDWEEKGHCHSYDADFGQDSNFRELYEAGILDADDVVEDFIEGGDWVRGYDYEVDARGDYFEIYNLTRDELNRFESDFYKSFKRWAKEKWVEHEDELPDDDEDYDEDEDWDEEE